MLYGTIPPFRKPIHVGDHVRVFIAGHGERAAFVIRKKSGAYLLKDIHGNEIMAIHRNKS